MPAIRGPGGRFLSKSELAELDNQTNTNAKDSNMTQEITAPEFVDELPTVKRKGRESGVWKERLEPLYDHQGQWAKVYGPTNNPHAVINNVRQGNAAGIDADEFSFAGRILGTDTVVDEETGEEKEVKEGYVYARYDTDKQRAEREEKQAKRAAARAESNGQVDEDDDEDDL